MSLPLPAATLDHVVVNARDRLDEALDTYRRLGFHMTPRGYHTLGSMNHLAIFGTNYLELIAINPATPGRADVMRFPIGLNGLVFGTEDSAGVYAALREAGAPIEAPNEFSRPVALAQGERDAVFRTAHVSPGIFPSGRVYFCHHFTRDLVWRDEWRHHPNGTLDVARAVIAAEDTATSGALFASMFGAHAVKPIRGGCRLAVGLASFDIITPAELVAQFGDAAPAVDGRAQYMAALTLRTCSLDMAQAALSAGGIAGTRRETGRITVPAAEAFGVALEFSE
jgi:hypothetical protein